MNISRRGFLWALAAAFVADPERLLWVPGKKMISIPSANIEIAEPFLDQISAITLHQMRNENFFDAVHFLEHIDKFKQRWPEPIHFSER